MRWFPFVTSPNGTTTEIAWQRDGGKRTLITREIIPAELHNRVMNENHAIGAEIGSIKQLAQTKARRVPVARMVPEMYWRWRVELGDYRVDPEARKRWVARLNDHGYLSIRVAQGQI